MRVVMRRTIINRPTAQPDLWDDSIEVLTALPRLQVRLVGAVGWQDIEVKVPNGIVITEKEGVGGTDYTFESLDGLTIVYSWQDALKTGLIQL